MKTKIIISLLCLALAACSGTAAEPAAKPTKPSKNLALRLTLLPQGDLVAGKPVTVLAKLTNAQERALLTGDDLDNQEFHLLAIDPTFSDYQPIHPQPTKTKGVYSFSFTPKTAGGYRAWADVLPKATGKQEFASADLGSPKRGATNNSETREVGVDGYHFTLAFDKQPAMGSVSVGTLRVTDRKGNPVSDIESVHIAGFYDDFRTVLHTAPETRNNSEPTFRLTPTKTGFLKLFAAVKVKGKDYYAPFGVLVGK